MPFKDAVWRAFISGCMTGDEHIVTPAQIPAPSSTRKDVIKVL
jgi:hypothetical protein